MSGSHLALEAVVALEDRLIARCLMRRGMYVIGQGRKNEIVVDDESISDKHARLTVSGDHELLIEDLGSANGTIVDGRLIDQITPVTLESRITLGKATLSFERGGLPAGVFSHLPAGFLRTARYTIGRVIVEGTNTAIHEARDNYLQRDVAMKVLRPISRRRASKVLGFIRENQIVAQLTHSNILPVHDLGIDEKVGLFSISRFVQGGTLAALLEGMASGDSEAPHATLRSLITIFLKTCDALAFAHIGGVIHGALKPEAVLIGRFGEVFVDHWATARVGQPLEVGITPLKAPEAMAEAPFSPCTAPEQVPAAAEFDARADVYALGAMLFHILTLRNFNSGENREEIVTWALKRAKSPAELLSATPRPAHIPRGAWAERLSAICVRALSLEPGERFTTAHELKMEVTRAGC